MPERSVMYGNLRVPYVAAWSSERVPFVGFDDAVGHPVLYREGRQGDGVPVFGKMAEERQRECVMRKRCQVCGEAMEPPYFAIDAERQQMRVWGARDVPLLSEPMVCGGCAAYSLESCPGIARMRAGLELRCYVIERYVRVACFLKPLQSSEYPELDAVLAKFGRPVVGFVKYAPTKFRTLPEAEFLLEVKR